MKNITIILMLFVYFTKSNAQNLVPNPSFELKNNCPSGLGYPVCRLMDTTISPPYCLTYIVFSGYFDSTVVGWTSYRETPDYFNTCASPSSRVQVPSNVFGYQYAFDGNGYVGITTYNVSGYVTHYAFDSSGHYIWDTISNYYSTTSDTDIFREYIGAKLTSNLTIGAKYYVTYWVNRARQDNPNDSYASGAATNNLDMRFSTVPYSFRHPAPINNTSHIHDPVIITDSISWTRISGSFIADSSYGYLAIGNFFNYQYTDTTGVGPFFGDHRAYYYIDQVCVSSDSTYCYSLPNSIRHNDEASSIKVYPNPFLNTLKIETESNQPAKIKIYDELSRLVLEKEFVNSVVLNTETLNSGFYYYEVVERNGLIHKGKLVKGEE